MKHRENHLPQKWALAVAVRCHPTLGTWGSEDSRLTFAEPLYGAEPSGGGDCARCPSSNFPPHKPTVGPERETELPALPGCRGGHGRTSLACLL